MMTAYWIVSGIVVIFVMYCVGLVLWEAMKEKK